MLLTFVKSRKCLTFRSKAGLSQGTHKLAELRNTGFEFPLVGEHLKK